MTPLFKTLFCQILPIAILGVFLIRLFVVHPLLVRRSRQIVGGLAELFDPGTAEIDKLSPFQRYFNSPSIIGLYHGRPTRILPVPSLLGGVEVSVASHSLMQFEARSQRFPILKAIRKCNQSLSRALIVPLYLSVFIIKIEPEIKAWKITAGVFLFFAAMHVGVWVARKLMGYDDGPKEEKWEVSVRGAPLFRCSTWSPWRYRPILDEPEIQDMVGRLIGTYQVDLLRSPSQARLPRKFQLSNGLLFAARSQYCGKLVDREFVRGMLTELIILCNSIEQKQEAVSPMNSAPA